MASDHGLLLSSPDPLGSSLIKNPTSSPTRSPKRPTTPRKVLGESHGNTQIQQFYLTTPSDARNNSSSLAKSSTRAHSVASPWRIKVTVEAEPENTMADTPSKRLAERKTTTTVPLKSADDSSPPVAKRGRGRPRKSMNGPVKRRGTPKPKKTGRRATANNDIDEDADDMPSEAMPSREKGSGRSTERVGSSPAKPDPQDSDTGHTEELLGHKRAGGSEVRTRSRARRKTMTPKRKRAAPDNSDLTAPADDGLGSTKSANRSSKMGSEASPIKCRPAKRRSLARGQEPEDADLPLDASTPDIARSKAEQHDMSAQQAASSKTDEDMWRSMVRQDSPLHADGDSKDARDSIDDGDECSITGNDPTDEHQEFNSIMESEGFSMVSVSSLPSAQQHSGSLASNQNSSLPRESHVDVSSGPVLASVKSNNTSQLRTPSLSSSTSSMPPPPIPSTRPRASPRPMMKPTDGTPRLGRVVRAGIALQGVLDPGDGNSQSSSTAPDSSAPSSASNSSKERLDHLFDGFGGGTRRELRAGLRLGEELAKRQQPEQRQNRNVGQTEDDVFGQDFEPTYPQLASTEQSAGYSLRLPGAGQSIAYPSLPNPQLPSPAGSVADGGDDHMSWKASSPMANEPVLPTIQHSSTRHDMDQATTEPQSTPRELRWQREREAVSKKIQEANTSQVMVIDSDSEEVSFGKESEEDGDEDEDIWQEEANSSRSISNSSSRVVNALLQAGPPKPRRSKLPSPWRQGNQVIYSDDVETADSDRPKQPRKEAVTAIHKGEVEKQQMHQEPSSSGCTLLVGAPDISTPAGYQVKIKNYDGRSAVEKPGWRPVEGRLQTPARKATHHDHRLTLKNVLADHYGSDSVIDEADEDEDDDMSDDNQQSLTNCSVLSEPNSPSDGRYERDDVPADALEDEQDTILSVEEITHQSLEDELPKPRIQMSRTPPGSPPQHLYSTLYLPPQPEAPSTSWLGRLTTYLPRLRTPAATPIPNANKLDPAKWNLHSFGPLYTHLPMDGTHYRVFRPYFEAQMANPGTYPFNPYSPSAKHLNTPIWAKNNYGWVRYLSKSDLGLIDKFMQVLKLKGVERRPGLLWSGDGKKIEEIDVALYLFDFWQAGVMQGTCRVEYENGNRIGNVPRTNIPVTPGKLWERPRWKKEVFLVP